MLLQSNPGVWHRGDLLSWEWMGVKTRWQEPRWGQVSSIGSSNRNLAWVHRRTMSNQLTISAEEANKATIHSLGSQWELAWWCMHASSHTHKNHTHLQAFFNPHYGDMHTTLLSHHVPEWHLRKRRRKREVIIRKTILKLYQTS